ncbi:hypothetical protein RJZ56_006313 [Blastomyces dermatitidis]|uniref:Ferric oxidoreductase domain-containing protein n=1 Tax=Ajellomyces dermatitidis (strain ER-3 / ATCC MYA-2586) TaxID=559297 RepID=A0ABP2EKV4_AJEDR|nr:uncharacterized protein BDCG_00551 [Blastomyces dermatitidis ER-3]EEQ83746.1 hypothetical protein BDCG_00551 [Blastomyces dermatitidis ER-3]
MSSSDTNSWLSSLVYYRYTSPTPEQLRERRELLNLRGEYAQLSTLVLLLLFSVYRFGANRGSGRSRGNGNDTATDRGTPSWLDSPLMRGGGETRGQYLVAAVWMIWLLALSAWRTGDDYLHLTKSLGHTTLATIPFNLLLSPKLSTTTNPFNLICSNLLLLPQTHLTPYHRLFGRLVIPALISLHSLLYLIFFAENGVLETRLNDSDVQFGIWALFALVGLWWTSGWVRRKGSSTARSGSSGRMSKRGAYVLHVAFVMLLLGVVYFHVEHARRFVVQALVIYGVDVGSWVVRMLVVR